MRLFSLLRFLSCLSLVLRVLSQGGSGSEQQQQEEVDMQGNLAADAAPAAASGDHSLLAAKLKATYPALQDQDAVDIAIILHTARQDPDTTWLLYNLREGNGKEHFRNFAKDATPAEIVQALKASMDEINSVDILFQDPQRAVKEMLSDGLIPPDKIDLYRNDPASLEEDLRKNLYFMLVSYAAAGGWL